MSNMSYVSIFLAGILINNMVISRFLGVCPFYSELKRTKTALIMSGAVTLVLTLAAAITYPVSRYLLYPDFSYLETVIFVLISVSLVQLADFVLDKFFKSFYDSLGFNLPLLTTNCAVLGVTMLYITDGFGFWHYLLNALATGIGFALSMFLFAGVRTKLEKADIPDFLKGLPITLVSAAIVALAFLGFTGIA